MQYQKTNKTALVCAVDLLAACPYSKAALAERLQRKGFAEEEIAQAVQRLVDRGYLDDAALCAHMYQRLIAEKKYSFKQITYKLLQKGFSESMISDCCQDDDWILERDAALRVLRGKYRDPGKAERMLMMRFLYQKGFARQAIDWAVEAWSDEYSLLENHDIV